MKLAEYLGPLDVGLVDLEVRVRNPRDFIPGYLDPVSVNKLVRGEKKIKHKRAQKILQKMREANGGPIEVEADWEEDNEEVKQERKKERDYLEKNGLKLRNSTLHFRTVLMGIYYPTTSLSEEKLKQYPRPTWLGRPLPKTAIAAWKYMGQYGAFARSFLPALVTMCRAVLPAFVCAPLGDPSKIMQDNEDLVPKDHRALATKTFPVVFFCHGLAGNRLAYSREFCGNLASHGFVVVAIEHRDGSGLGSFVWTGVDSLLHSSKAKMKRKDRERFKKALSLGASQSVMDFALENPDSSKSIQLNNEDFDPLQDFSHVPYLAFENIGLAPFMAKQGDKEIALRRAQLAMRAAEVQEALHIVRKINEGDSDWVAARHTRSLGAAFVGASRFKKARRDLDIPHCADFFRSWEGKLDVEFPSLAGHSFGGATLIEFLRSDQEDFKFGIVLDPWMDPVRDPLDDPEIRNKLNKPIYVLNSEGFTLWRDQYNKLIRVLVDALTSNPDYRGWLMTLCGSNHTDFSDLPYLLPHIFGSVLSGPQCMHTFSLLALEQIRLLREQKQVEDIDKGRIADNLGPLKDKIYRGGMHFNSHPEYPRPSKSFLKKFQDNVLRIRSKPSDNKTFFWELRGWRKQAERDPGTRAYRKHRRILAREIQRAAKEEQTRQQQRRNSIAVSDTASLPQIQDLEEIRQEMYEAEARETGNDGHDDDFKPVFIDPLEDEGPDGDDPWAGTVLDSDARKTYEVWDNDIPDKAKLPSKPTSLLTWALWWFGVREGLAPAGHLLVHTF
ncbi:1-alkyl-2-acetylglycerophosphocholine esterase [Malassezia psittaci]|uniref:1-alkyl-2-acetylglycerophosphocholine esterase n=1 Tax=Malassezia psittaci TaxID=1821823 RepID=A0AAF0JJ73_9BASI|nr:1-alkyl-2-acetylglycerophosphocholine esterase [Malassezia psittaci]